LWVSQKKIKVVGKNPKGEKQTVGSEPFEIKIVDVKGLECPVEISDLNNGEYEATFTPTSLGPLSVAVSLDDKDLAGSPAKVIAKPEKPLKADLDGPGLKVAFKDKPATFTVSVKDDAGELVDVDPQYIDCAFSPIKGAEEGPKCKVEKTSDGKYAVSYVPENFGIFGIQPTLFGTPLISSPHELKVVENVSTDNCDIPNFPSELSDAEDPKFILVAKGDDGLPLKSGGAPFEATVGNGDQSFQPEIIDNGDGTYAIGWDPEKLPPGDYDLDVKLGDNSIKGSPFKLKVKEGPAADHSELVFVPVTHCSVRVKLYNRKGEPRTTGGDDVHVTVKGPEGPVPDISVTDNNDGTYTVEYQGTPGEYKVSAKIKGFFGLKHVKDSPFTYVIPNVEMKKKEKKK